MVMDAIRKLKPETIKLISVNGKSTHNYKLPEIIGLFASKSGKKITLKIKRNGAFYKKKFYLKEVFK
jgi:C-terminal processing protease CtpA/Prc